MTPLVARILCLLALAGLFVPALLRALGGADFVLPAWAPLPPGVKLAVLLLAPSALLADGEHNRYSRVLAAAGLLLVLVMLLGAGITQWRGLERGISMLDQLRPTTLTMAGIAALAASLFWRPDTQSRLDVSAVLGLLACALFFLIFVAHLFGASTLTVDPRAGYAVSSTLGALLLLLAALAALGVHEGGPMTAYRGDDTGAVAMRRLLPAAILTPISVGLLLLIAIDDRGLPPSLSVALAAFTNIVVMLVLIHNAGSRVSAVSQAKEKTWEKRGSRDALTGLLNRGGWDLAVKAAQDRCMEESIEACVLMVDLDGLKRINDSEGHAAGDEAIRECAQALQAAARRGDTLARLGGDEFAYLAVDCDIATAANIAKRFEESLAAANVAGSVGYALTRRGAIAEAIENADRSMYQHKRARKKQKRSAA